jgi:hypothetical protein
MRARRFDSLLKNLMILASLKIALGQARRPVIYEV